MASEIQDQDIEQPAVASQIDLPSLRACIIDLTQPVAKRTHAAFHLRTIGSVDAMGIIAEALRQREDSSLMRHELAYILGQMQCNEATETLSNILKDENEDILVRHESAEALGALGQMASLELLLSFTDHSAPEIAETCQIAVDLIKYRHEQNGGKQEEKGAFLSVDPAPGFTEVKSITELESDLLNPSLSLFVRYRAMFSLRDINTDESALAIAKGFSDSSALFRHEVAYVLGQLMRKVTVPELSVVLRNITEHRMVRHEAAEALGAIGTKEAEEVLQEFQHDEELVVTQSCEVALDTVEYWKDF
jgi:deoxyhypusine monooxygenase